MYGNDCDGKEIKLAAGGCCAIATPVYRLELGVTKFVYVFCIVFMGRGDITSREEVRRGFCIEPITLVCMFLWWPKGCCPGVLLAAWALATWAGS